MAIKLVAVDLDDTLLDKTTSVSPRARAAIREAVKQGVTVTISTGRMYQSAVRYARQLELDVPIITYNGALIKSCFSEETFFQRPIEQETATKVLTLFRERGWYIQSYINDVLYVDEINNRAQNYEKLASVKAYAIGEKLYTPQEGPLKMLAIAEPKEIDCIRETLKSTFNGSICVANSKPTYLEIIDPTVNKGRALSFLAQKLNIGQQEIMAVGDSNNDLDMIQFAGFGVAMGNASDNVKAAAQAVTLRNDEDGVAEAIEKYVLR